MKIKNFKVALKIPKPQERSKI